MSPRDFLQSCFCRFFEFLIRQRRYYRYKRNIREGYLQIGEHSYGMPEVQVYKGSEAKVTIGKYCSIAPDVTFITGGIHPVDWVSTFPFRARWGLPGGEKDGMPATKGDIVVGNDVWIGTHTIVLSGVKIGHGAVICSGSVVSKDIQPYCVAGGVPAKTIKKRFSDDEIGRLLELKWWDCGRAEILEDLSLLSSPNLRGFLEKNAKRIP